MNFRKTSAQGGSLKTEATLEREQTTTIKAKRNLFDPAKMRRALG